MKDALEDILFQIFYEKSFRRRLNFKLSYGVDEGKLLHLYVLLQLSSTI